MESTNKNKKRVARKTAAERVRQVVDWVTNRYLVEGKDSTVKEIAAGIGCSEGIVRRALDSRAELTSYQEVRTSHSTDYKWMPSGVHKVRCYGPRRSYLAQIIRKLRQGENG